MVRWLGDSHHGQFVSATSQIRAVIPLDSPVASDQFNADASQVVPAVCCLRYLRTAHAVAANATSVGPALSRQWKSVLSRPRQMPAASPPHPVLVSCARPADGGFLKICEGTTHHGSEEDKMATTATTTPNQHVMAGREEQVKAKKIVDATKGLRDLLRLLDELQSV